MPACLVVAAVLLLRAWGALGLRVSWPVTPAEAVRFVDAIGGERILQRSILSAGTHVEAFQDPIPGFSHALQFLRNVFGLLGDAESSVLLRRPDMLEDLLLEHGGRGLFDWLRSPHADKELIERIGVTDTELSVLRFIAFQLAPVAWGYDDEGFEFTYAPSGWFSPSLRSRAQLRAFVATHTRTYFASCNPSLPLSIFVVAREHLGERAVLVARFAGSDIVFPNLQPWIYDDDELVFFGQLRREVKTYVLDFLLPLSTGDWNVLAFGEVPKAVSFKFESLRGEPVISMSKILLQPAREAMLEPWCVAATTPELVEEYAFELVRRL